MTSSSISKHEQQSLKRALFALKDLRARLSDIESKQTEPLAVIGIGCRLPGAGSDADEFWRLLREGREAIGEVPADRWDVDRFYDADPEAPGKTYTRYGAFLEDVDKFDAAFFGISPREAENMDPQQRLLLETSWEALERAGIAADKLARSSTGIYVGISATDYAQLQLKSDDLSHISPYLGTGTTFSVAAGRLSYFLGAQGPALAIDTACSSSLVALHMACQALRADQIDLALVGGVNLILQPEGTVYMSKVRALSPDGRCKTFDAAADGYGRGEGCGVVVVKRLSDAEADNDNILAVIRGTAINHDGPSSGLTVPNGQAQQAVIRAALDDAGDIAPHEIDYLEAHGTGTPLGDPIEIRAAAAVLGQDRPVDAPLYVGSVKTNVGHLEAAAGVTGLIKLVLAIGHNELPPHLNFSEPSPHIDWENTPVQVVQERLPWEGPERLAGISSFGFSGTNAHAIVGSPPIRQSEPARTPRPKQLVALAAQSELALTTRIEELHRFLTAHPEVDLARVAQTLNRGRVHFAHRVAVAASSTTELVDALATVSVRDKYEEKPRIAFLFTGQGAQLNRMGRRLYETQPTFRAHLDRCNVLLEPYLETPLLDVVFAEPGTPEAALIDETVYTQPSLFALEYSLAMLWQSWGIVPGAVMGHSVGEYVAACIAGVFSLEDGLKLIAARGRLMQSLPPGGAMAAVFASETEVKAVLTDYQPEISIAAINGPNNTVISGAESVVEAVLDQLGAKGIKSRRLVVSHAFHSSLMDDILDDFASVAESVTYHEPALRLISNVSGRQVQGDEAQTAAYWRDHIRQPVRFAESVEHLLTTGFDCFVEIGPQPTLSGMAARIPGAADARFLPSLRKNQDDWDVLLRTLGELYVSGAPIDWNGFEGDYDSLEPIWLPTYPFQRQRYWLESPSSEQESDALIPALPAQQTSSAHVLLGQRLATPLPIYAVDLSVRRFPYLSDHQVFGFVVFPASAYMEIALAAAADYFGRSTNTVTDLTIQDALFLDAQETRRVQIAISPQSDNMATFQLFSQVQSGDSSSWQQHASGVLHSKAYQRPAAADTLADVQSRLKTEVDTEVDIEGFYAGMANLGVDYGPAFRGVERLWRGKGEALGRIQLPSNVTNDGYFAHPALLDACLHVLAASVEDVEKAPYLPVNASALHQLAPLGSAVYCYARMEGEGGGDMRVATLQIWNEDGDILLVIDGLRLQRVSAQTWQRATFGRFQQWLYEFSWKPQPHTPDVHEEEPQHWLILADRGGVGATLAERLSARGHKCTLLGQEEWEASESEGWDTLLQQSFHNVVDLWSLDIAVDGDPLPAQGQILEHTLGLVQALVALKDAPRLWLLTRDSQAVEDDKTIALAATSVWGLGRVLAQEHPRFDFVQIDLDDSEQIADHILADLQWPGEENQIAFRKGRRYVARLVRWQPKDAPLEGPVQLDISERGVLDNLVLRPMSRQAPGPGEVEIEVVATGLNFRDVLNALGMYPEAAPLGGECAGRIAAVGPGVTEFQVGDEVVALVSSGFKSYAVTNVDLVAHKPRTLDFVEAAGVPIVFLTAAFALDYLGQMEAGDKVLIHAATGGVGMAALQIAQRADAEVFATASQPKWDTLKQQGIRHIYNSRTLDFADEIDRDTDGAGVAIALNSLAGEFIPATLGLVAENGHFVEIGRTDTWDDESVAAEFPGVNNHVFFLGELCVNQPKLVQKMMRDVLTAIEDGTLEPLPTSVFPISDAVEAFRYMAQAKHIGKIVILQQPAHNEGNRVSEPRADATYLVSGGTGGLGMQVARWMVEQGARHIALVSRSAPSDPVRETLAELRESGANIRVLQGDVSQREEVDRVMDEIGATMPVLRGVVHAAGVLDDGLIVNQSWSRFARVLSPKGEGAWHLHEATLEQDLDFFVLFSSTSALLGTVGQANYAAANAFLDGLAQYRRARGLPALSINWSAWSEVGMAVASGSEAGLEEYGIQPIQPRQGVTILGRLLSAPLAQMAVLPVDWHVFGRRLALYKAHPILSDLLTAETHRSVASGGEVASLSEQPAIVQQLTAASMEQRPDLLRKYVTGQVRVVMGLDAAAAVDRRQPLMEMGLDSLMSVELRNALNRSLDESLPASLLFDYPSIDSLSSYLLTRLDLAEPVIDKGADEVDAVTVVGRDEPVAIVGLSCRFPGQATEPEAFWEVLRDGVDAISEVPADRWDVDAYYDSDPDAPGKMYTRWGGFIEDIDKFDPQFFSISPREAVQMDPQQRFLLELSWEALERAGIAPDTLVGTKTGVFIGISTNDYGQLVSSLQTTDTIDAYYGTGAAYSVAAGRLSYVLGLQGPSFAIDTACSSSLVALHQAVRSLRERESNVALVGGVNLILRPEGNIYFSKVRAMSFDGRCKTFSAAADGYVRSEGGGIVTLKRLSDAERDGNPILAIIYGTAINHDGRSNGLTAPNGLAQQDVIRAALANAGGLSAGDIDYVEAHGTGTALGDPIELQSLGEVVSEGHSAEDPLLVGSVKTNIGHLEAAAGVAGLIKVVLALQHEELPPHLHFNEPSPHVDWEALPLKVVTERTPWKGDKRLAGLSSFGFSGTNAHVIIGAAPVVEKPAASGARPQQLLTISARSTNALRAQMERMARFVERLPEESLVDLAYTSSRGRSHFNHRYALVADSMAAVREQLIGGSLEGVQSSQEAPRVAFLFTGQGAQYPGMGKHLYQSEPIFRDAVDECAAILDNYLETPLLSILFADDAQTASMVHDTTYTQPALFVIEYALAQLWLDWGIRPAAVMGHSIGEITAACVAGVLNLQDALKLVAERGRLMGSLPEGGAMAAVFTSEAEVEAALADYGDAVAIAAANGPGNIVISGNTEAVAAVQAIFEARGVHSRRLTVSHAFHSPLMDPILDAFEQVAESLTYNRPRLRLVSNVSGDWVQGDEMQSAVYWRNHVRQAVQFSRSIGALMEDDITLLLEVGPQPALLSMARRIPGAKDVQHVASMRRDRDESREVMAALGELYQAGINPDWPAVYRHLKVNFVELPTYPFERQRYWVDTSTPAARRRSVSRTSSHPLLGQQLRSAAQAIQYEVALDPTQPSFLGDYRIFDAAIVPMAAYVEMMMATATALNSGSYELNELDVWEALVLTEEEAKTVQVIVDPSSEHDKATIQVFSLNETDADDPWKLHASGTIQQSNEQILTANTLDSVLSRCAESLDVEDHYDRLQDIGISYGPQFQAIEQLWRCDGEAVGKLRLPDVLVETADHFQVHPVMFDACLQLLAAARPGSVDQEASVFLPVGLRGVRVYGGCRHSAWAHVSVMAQDGGVANDLSASVTLYDDDGHVIAEVDSVYLRRASRDALRRSIQGNFDDLLYEVTWERQDHPSRGQRAETGTWLIFADEGGVGGALAEHLQRRGAQCVIVHDAGVASEGGDCLVDPTDAKAVRTLLDDVRARSQSLQGVVYLWGLNRQASGMATVEKSVSGALHLVQALATEAEGSLPGLWLVTRGSQPVSNEAPPAVFQAPLWGLGGTIANEHPGLRCARIDLDVRSEGDESEILFKEIWAPTDEKQVAFRSNQRYVARFVRARRAAAGNVGAFRSRAQARHVGKLVLTPPTNGTGVNNDAIRDDATYLITGGMGALGLEVLTLLVNKGARHVVLVGRREPSQTARRRITELAQSGAEITVAQADVSRMDEIKRVVQQIEDTMPTLKGIFHVAGVLDDGVLLRQDWARFERVLAPKVDGAWNLHQLTQTHDLDFFVLFSSIASLMGAPGQGSYAAANLFLDQLAHFRQAKGLPALSINWGPWASVGMAAERSQREQRRLLDQGIRLLEPALGNEVLATLLEETLPQIAVLPMNWTQFKRAASDAPIPYMEHVLKEVKYVEPVEQVETVNRQVIEAAEPDERAQLVQEALCSQLARTLQLPVASVGMEQTLNNLGLDSLMAVELKNHIELTLGVNVPVSYFLSGTTVAQLSSTVLEELTVAGEAGVASTPGDGNHESSEIKDASQILGQLDDLSDEQVDAMLRDLLAEENSD